MIPYLRKEKILNYMQGKDVVYFDELSEKVGYSISTVRRDLIALDKEGVITLLRGGAAKMNKSELEEPVILKKLVNVEPKNVIAKKAASLVEDGDVIYIDSGTTTGEMYKYLRDKKITVVTSGIPNIEEVAKCVDMHVILLGGDLWIELESVVGTLTEKQIENMYFDKAFIGCNGYGEEGGISTFDIREARKKELVKEHAKEIFVLADTSKANKQTFSKVCDLKECILITEQEN